MSKYGWHSRSLRITPDLDCNLATPPQTIAQIRFAIEDQLSARNAHHEFEHLCRHFARLRICSNILPATGPVAAGGDQGRDFETFRTYIHESDLNCSSFVGLVSEGPVVFGCSLQKTNIAQKIKKDISLIAETGQYIASIHMFWGCDIPVGRRHELQAWARKHHDVHLELYDAQALSELLCHPEIFWIAEQYLSIPGEFRPDRQISEGDNWYEAALERWRKPADFVANPANFHELASAVRYATFAEDAKSDLPLWISRIRTFQETDECPVEFYWRATYEIAVASLRGLGTLEGLQDELRGYFSRVNRLTLAAQLEDVSVLAQYCWGAYHHNAGCLPLNEIYDIGNNIQERLRELIATSQSITSKCMYLETLGFNCMMLSTPKEHPSLPSMNETSRLWAELLDLVGDAPLYPLERFADRVTGVIGLVGTSAVLENITEKLDRLLAKRFGGFKAAEKCRDRSLALKEKGHILGAINELHRAKIAWFAEETLGGSILTMQMLSALYLELGLSYAGKQYAMAAAYIAVQTARKDLKKYAPRALMQTARCDYRQGSWCDFFSATNASWIAYHLVPNQDHDQEVIDNDIEETCYHTAIALTVAERFAPEIVSSIQEVVAEWPFNDVVEDALGLARDAWSQESDTDVWDNLQDQILGRPFGDVAKIRTVDWKQIGLTWEVSWRNSYVLTTVAEQFIATAQILMAEWAGVDLCILRTVIRIEVDTWDKDGSTLESEASNKGRKWLLKFSEHRAHMDVQQLQREAFGFVASIIREVSLLSDEDYFQILEKSFQDGVASKVQIARPYEELYRSCVVEPRPFEKERLRWRPARVAVPFRIKEHPDMAWFGGSGPGYSKDLSEEHVRNRYDNITGSIRHTLGNLSANRAFLNVVKKLKGEGWLDWHILVSVGNITWNYRFSSLDRTTEGGVQEMKDSMKHIMEGEERESTAPVPMSAYTEEAIRMALRMSQMATLKTLGLECRQQTPDFDAIDDFLRERFNYWKDDVEHENPFRES